MLKSNSHLETAAAIPLEIKADSAGQIAGYASTFGGSPDRQGDLIMVGAFALTLQEHMQRGSRPAMLAEHDQARPIGSWTSLAEDDRGLRVEGRFDLATTEGQKVYQLVKSGSLAGLSIGYATRSKRYLGGETNLLEAVDLAEISVVAVPANPSAGITYAKRLESKSEAIDLLRQAGLSKTAAARFAAGGWAALKNDGPDPDQIASLAVQIARATNSWKTK